MHLDQTSAKDIHQDIRQEEQDTQLEEEYQSFELTLRFSIEHRISEISMGNLENLLQKQQAEQGRQLERTQDSAPKRDVPIQQICKTHE